MTGFTKLFPALIHSTVWREPDHVRLVWITMLSIADRYGNVEASLPGLADAARVTLQQAVDAISRLSAPDEFSRSKVEGGRRILPMDGGWCLVNHSKYRRKAAGEDQRAKTAERVRRHREKKRSVTGNARSNGVTGETPPESEAEAEANTEAEADQTRARSAPPPPPSGFDEAMRLPVERRARWCVERADVAEWIEPARWPEVVDAARALGVAVGEPAPRLGPTWKRDSGLRAVVELLAAGWSLADLTRAGELAKRSDYFRSKRGLATYTPAVVRRLMADESNGTGEAYVYDEKTGTLT